MSLGQDLARDALAAEQLVIALINKLEQAGPWAKETVMYRDLEKAKLLIRNSAMKLSAL